MMGKFSGKVVLVTGGASGIGRASVLAFAREGAKVAVSDILVEDGEKTVRSVTSNGQAKFFKADVSNSAEVASLIKNVLSSFGRLDVAFNNAGVECQPASVIDCSEETWDQVMNVNLKGIWLCMKHEIPHMIKQGGGTIVNMSSIAGLVGFRGLSPYTSSKHGVIGLTKTAALEFAKYKVRINAICPGLIDTPLLKRQMGEDSKIEKELLALKPMGRLGTPEEVAETVVWLSSDSASFVTGHTMTVDGGWTAH